MVQAVFLSLYNKGTCQKISTPKKKECRRKLRSRNFGNTKVEEIAWWLGDQLKVNILWKFTAVI
jgi:hypothetical protein